MSNYIGKHLTKDNTLYRIVGQQEKQSINHKWCEPWELILQPVKGGETITMTKKEADELISSIHTSL